MNQQGSRSVCSQWML